MTEDEMVEWHHRLTGHEFEQTPGDGEGLGSLACCSPWGCKILDMSEAWWATVCGVAKSLTGLQPASHSSSPYVALPPPPVEMQVLPSAFFFFWLHAGS